MSRGRCSALRTRRGGVAMLTGALALLSAGAGGAPAADTAPRFTPEERAQILSHGPWPPPVVADASNRWSGQPAAIALGARLLADPRLSGHGRLACISCHLPALGLADGVARGHGHDQTRLDRHTPGLWNTGQQRWWGWDGAYDSLWSQALHPLRHPAEMAAQAGPLRQWLRQDPLLACLARAAGGAAWLADDPAPDAPANTSAKSPPPVANADDRLLADVGKALAAYLATLVSPRTPFDEFRDALARGDAAAGARYPVAAQRGLKLFLGRGQCGTCHGGPLFSNGEFGDIGRPFFIRPGVVDAGRHGGIAALQASRFNLLGPHSDAPQGADDPVAWKTRHLLPQHRNFGEFKVPGLRNLRHSAPYMHDGSLPSLAAVLQHYDALDLDRLHADGEQLLRPLGLGPGEAQDLAAFLRSLSTARAPTLPPAPPLPAACAATTSSAPARQPTPRLR